MSKHQKTIDCNFLKTNEGQIVSLEGIASASGWSLNTVKIYVNKNGHGFVCGKVEAMIVF
jgi:hypothetical protein